MDGWMDGWMGELSTMSPCRISSRHSPNLLLSHSLHLLHFIQLYFLPRIFSILLLHSPSPPPLPPLSPSLPLTPSSLPTALPPSLYYLTNHFYSHPAPCISQSPATSPLATLGLQTVRPCAIHIILHRPFFQLVSGVTPVNGGLEE